VVPRDAPFDFIRIGGDEWLDRVALKTGTMTEPVSAFGISGYLRKRDGGGIAFAVVVKGSPAETTFPTTRQCASTAGGGIERSRRILV
jgi:D-alanyl-D-alanine carboxypeptidase/D-alanyl-D-alanine-endopeptidase (penicillin-binding protein 4)